MLCPGLSKADSIELWLTGLKKKRSLPIKICTKSPEQGTEALAGRKNFKKKIQVVTMNSFFVTVNEMQL